MKPFLPIATRRWVISSLGAVCLVTAPGHLYSQTSHQPLQTRKMTTQTANVTTQNNTNRAQVVRQFFKAYSHHDVEGMLSLFAPDATYEYVPYGDAGKGKVHQTAAGIWGGFMEALPDFKSEPQSIMTTTDGKVIAETIQGGTQQKDVAGITSKGKRTWVPHVFIFSFTPTGQIQALKAYWDNNTIFAQLGHTEPHQ